MERTLVVTSINHMGFIYVICRYNDVRRYGIVLVAYTISEIEMESLSQAHSFRMHTRMELWIMEIFDRSILYLRY